MDSAMFCDVKTKLQKAEDERYKREFNQNNVTNDNYPEMCSQVSKMQSSQGGGIGMSSQGGGIAPSIRSK